MATTDVTPHRTYAPKVGVALTLLASLASASAWFGWWPVLVLSAYWGGVLLGQGDAYRHDDAMDERYGRRGID